jgi:hypothetical protein
MTLPSQSAVRVLLYAFHVTILTQILQGVN